MASKYVTLWCCKATPLLQKKDLEFTYNMGLKEIVKNQWFFSPLYLSERQREHLLLFIFFLFLKLVYQPGNISFIA